MSYTLFLDVVPRRMLLYPYFLTSVCVCVCVSESVCQEAIIIVHGILLSCFRTKQSVSCSVSVKHETLPTERSPITLCLYTYIMKNFA